MITYEQNTKCHTARYRLGQAKFFLDKIKQVYSKDDYEIEYYLDSFLDTCRSVIDYVVRDYLNTVKPSIREIDKRLINKYRVRILDKNDIKNFDHEKKQEIIDFLKKHRDEFFKFRENHLVRYFLAKRTTYEHHEFSGFRQASFEQKPGESRKILSRKFIPLYYLLMVFNGKNLSNEEIESCELTDQEEKALLVRLEGEEAKDLLDEYLGLVEEFIAQFEK